MSGGVKRYRVNVNGTDTVLKLNSEDAKKYKDAELVDDSEPTTDAAKQGCDPATEDAWIAEVDGRRAGAVFCVREDAETARLRLLHVEPDTRGRGVGTLLVDTCLDYARDRGYRRMVLWTVSVLAPARRIYQRAGFALRSEEPARMFGRDLVGQTWARDL